jgi:putative transposase
VRRERAVQPRLGCRKLLHILHSEFKNSGVSIGRDRFFNLLSRNNLLIKRRSVCPRTTNSRHWFGVYENLYKDVCLKCPCQVVVSDITYIRTDEGFMYLSLIMDAYSRAIVGYDCSDSLEAEGALRSLSMAVKNLKNSSGVIHHSDRGIQYCCSEYIKRLKRGGFLISMTEVNHCY